MLLTNTPFTTAVGQILMTRLEVVAESPTSRTTGLTLERLSSMPPAELLPQLLGTSDDVWVMAARDILSRAQIRSKSIATKTNAAATYNGSSREAIQGPDIVLAALEIWGEPVPNERKRTHIQGVKVFLETALAEGLAKRGDSPRPATVAPPRSLSTMAMPAMIRPAPLPMGFGPLPDIAEGGLPVLRKLIANKPKRKEDFDAYALDAIKFMPWPVAMARMMGGDKLGQFVGVNESLLDRYKWRGREQHLLKMALLNWYHPDDRSVFTKVMFGLARAFLGKAPEFEPQPVRGLSGDAVEFMSKYPGKEIPEEFYVANQGAGVYMFSHGVTAFGIFTELPK